MTQSQEAQNRGWDAAEQANSLHHYQKHSRLHFIGQWKTKMQDVFMRWFADEHPEWNHGRLTEQALFVHVDMDAFFCSVQLAKPQNAEWRTKPVAIAAGKFNSDISSCNYIARSFGIRAGMYVNAARELCPELHILGYDLETCERVSKVLYRILFESCPSSMSMSVEVYSIDEVMVAVDTRNYNEVILFCEVVRREFHRATGCTASCGIGPNILLARVATAKAKPDGIHVIRREEVAAIMRQLPFRDIHGVGHCTLQKVHQLLCREGIIRPSSEDSAIDAEMSMAHITCADVQRVKKEVLQQTLGKRAGECFYDLCRGVDSRVVIRTGDQENQKALGKSTHSAIASSMNYAVRPTCVEDVWSIAKQLLGDVCLKLERRNLIAQGLRVTLLERHPLHPKETQKYMGRGHCVEVHLSSKFAHPLDARSNGLMLQEVQRLVSPLLVANRTMTDAQRADKLGLTRGVDYQVIRTVTLSDLQDVVVEDIRGMTVQVTGVKESGVASNRRLQEGQLTLADAFFHARAKPRYEDSPESVVVVETQALGDEPDARSGMDLVVSNSSHSDGDKGGSLSIIELAKLPWGDEFMAEWKAGCALVCTSADYAHVKAYLRCAAWKVAGATGVDDARCVMDQLYAFVKSRLPLPLCYL